METGLELPSGIPAPLQGAKSRTGAAKGKAWALRLCFQIKWQGTTMGVFPQKLDPTLENKWGEGKQFRLSGEGQRNRHEPRSSALGRGNAHLGFPPTPPTLCVSLEDKLPQHLGAHYVRGQPVSRQRNLPKEDLDRQRQIADLFADAPGPLLLEPPASND